MGFGLFIDSVIKLNKLEISLKNLYFFQGLIFVGFIFIFFLLISIVIFEKIDNENRKIETKNTLRLILI